MPRCCGCRTTLHHIPPHRTTSHHIAPHRTTSHHISAPWPHSSQAVCMVAGVTGGVHAPLFPPACSGLSFLDWALSFKHKHTQARTRTLTCRHIHILRGTAGTGMSRGGQTGRGGGVLSAAVDSAARTSAQHVSVGRHGNDSRRRCLLLSVCMRVLVHALACLIWGGEEEGQGKRVACEEKSLHMQVGHDRPFRSYVLCVRELAEI